VPIATKVLSSNSAHGEVYLIQRYVIKFVSDLRQVGGFLRVLWVSSTNKTERHDITEILLKVALNTITLYTLLPCLIPPQWCIVCVPTCVVDCGSYPWSKYKIGISCFSTWHAALMNKSRDRLGQNQDNVSKWSEMSICRLLFHCANTIKSNSACWSSTKQT